jgi:branched-chain amino acid transport system ATP-binding protein
MLRYAYPAYDSCQLTRSCQTMVDEQSADGGPIVLQASGLGRSFKGLKALSDYRVSLRRGEILGVIGPNGAGKTTLFNVITGFVLPTVGEISLGGESLIGKSPDTIVRLGIARTFQNIRLFSGMTVLENVLTAQQVRQPMGFAQSLLSLPNFRSNERRMREAALSHLRVLGLDHFADHPATSLPYGFQRKLEIARAVATGPSILLLDEPAAGMNAQETAELTGFIRQIRQQFDLTIIVVEHDMSLIMRLCDRIQVLNYGRIIAEDTPVQIRTDPAVIEAYLGAPEDEESPIEEAV